MIRTRLFFRFFLLFFILAALNLAGLLFHLHWTIWWFDILLHFLGGAIVSLAMMLVLFRVRPNASLSKAIAFGLLSAVVIGLLWEWYELYFDLTCLCDGQQYISDTIGDIIMDSIGGAIATLYAYRLRK